MKKLKKNDILTFLVDNLFYIAACILYSAGVTIFSVPNNIAQSGMTGVAIIINYLFRIPLGVANFLINVPLLILAWIFLGRKFTFKTLYVTAMLSFAMDLFSKLIEKDIIQSYHGDKMLAAIFCGALCGAGLSMAYLRESTTGGTDIIMRLIKKMRPHYSMGKLVMVLDGIIVISAAIVFKSAESALYAVVLIFVSSRIIDYITIGVSNGKMMYIFTEKPHEVANAITSQMTRGVSIIPIEGGYAGEPKSVLLIVLRSHEVATVRRIVKKVDNHTFITIAEVREVLGEGFKTPPADSN